MGEQQFEGRVGVLETRGVLSEKEECHTTNTPPKTKKKCINSHDGQGSFLVAFLSCYPHFNQAFITIKSMYLVT